MGGVNVEEIKGDWEILPARTLQVGMDSVLILCSYATGVSDR